MESQRLIYRAYTKEDDEFYASMWGQPDIVRYIGKGLTKTKKEAVRSLENWILPGYKNGMGLFVIILKETGEPIGHAGLVPQVVEGRKETEIGYWLKSHSGEKDLLLKLPVFLCPTAKLSFIKADSSH